MGCLRGLEPPIFGTTTRRFNQLSYRHHKTTVSFYTVDHEVTIIAQHRSNYYLLGQGLKVKVTWCPG